MMATTFSTAVAALGLASLLSAGPGLAELRSRNKRDTSSPVGQEYQRKATATFWGDAAFMRECVPPDAPVPEPLTIYFLVRPDGTLGTLHIAPDNAVAKCIRENVQGRQFSQRKDEFVAKIDLKFQE